MARRRDGEVEGVVVAAVAADGDAGRAGLRPGDRILTINGEPVRDVIDFHFNAGDSRLECAVERGGAATALTVERRGRDLGLELVAPTPSEISTCANKCVFCFIHQLPRGMRKSLYVKDDDYRLSFLHGNYITLTDLEEPELRRIETQRLSPLYVSVHATDPSLRHRLLGEPRVQRDLMPIMARLGRSGIRMHAQIVLCPGWNDGAHLERSIRDLAALHPAVATTAVVPVGLTAHRERLPRLRTLTADEARALARTLARWQAELLARLGTRFIWGGDELYLQAGLPIPSRRSYEGFPVVEDGIGLVRRFEDDWARVRRRAPARLARPRAVTVVTGGMYAPRLTRLLASLSVEGLTARVQAIDNEWFGGSVQVAGLLTGADIQRQLAGTALGEAVLVPSVALRDGAGVFLDDLTPADLTSSLGVPVHPVEPDARALLAALVAG